MQKLSKIDLEPNEIYNVSFNIKQGDKNVDTLRFFQTQVPKLFNIKPSTFSTFSQINESATSVNSKVINSGISDGGSSNPVVVKSVSWTSKAFPASREDGVTSYEPEGFEYTFVITFDSTPNFTSYYISGFKGPLDFLNYRTDYKVVGKTLSLTLSLADIDPTAETKYLVSSISTNAISPSIVDEVKKGYTTLYLPGDTDLSKVVVGKSVVTALTSGARATYVWNRALITGIGKFTDDKGRTLKWISVGKAALADKAANTQIAIYGINAGYTFTSPPKTAAGTQGFAFFGKGPASNDSSKETVKSANIVWQTFPTYDATKAKTDYTFKKSSSITSSVLNPNVIEKLIWEDEVRDYIYFIISDVDTNGDKKKYFFGTYGAIETLSTETTSLKGSVIFNPNSPPAAHGDILDINKKRFRSSTGKVEYYQASQTQTNNQNVPELLRTVEVRFAIARYIKKGDTWDRYWLPKGGSSEEILSTEEVLD